MLTRLNKRSLPFIILFVIHVGILAYTIYRKGPKNTIRLFTSNIGMAYVFEYFVLNLFEAYKYSPNILKNSYFDNIFGAILSQAIYVPISATFITLFKLNWKWKLFFSAFLVIIERLFLFLNIYNNRWWKTLFTALLIPTYFYISDYWHLYSKNRIIKNINIYLTFIVIQVNVLYIYAVFGVLCFGKNNWRDHFIIAPFYSLIMGVIYTLNSKKSSLKRHLTCSSVIIITDFLLQRSRIMKSNWTALFLPMHIILLLIGRKVHSLYQSPDDALSSEGDR
ncbi:hypothetical protein ACERII_14710 [Evansella sp. AB-rgal1]|uniref:hypothetical protein n=1 Tax=Evansella sp. AB-rgal1 TaxID=3242696 RepID=UPI00359D1091